MIEIYNKIYDMISSGDYSFIFRMIIITLSFSMMINVLRYVLGSIGSGCSGDDSESDNSGKKVDLTKNNMFTKYYDHYDQD